MSESPKLHCCILIWPPTHALLSVVTCESLTSFSPRSSSLKILKLVMANHSIGKCQLKQNKCLLDIKA